MKLYNRWYDGEPTLGLAVSLLRSAVTEVRTGCASFVIERAKAKDVQINTSLMDLLEFTFKRWYDEDPQLMEAMEYIRNSSPEVRKELALDIIEYLQNVKNK